MENKQKHLEFIQTTISRMANNSFLLKGWAITLVAALFALSAKDTDGYSRNDFLDAASWEAVRKQGDEAIKKWINEQMKYKSCTVVLVGKNTADRKWINYEIVKSWNEGMGVVGIYIHGFKNSNGYISEKGENPFDYITYGDTGKKFIGLGICSLVNRICFEFYSVLYCSSFIHWLDDYAYRHINHIMGIVQKDQK